MLRHIATLALVVTTTDVLAARGVAQPPERDPLVILTFLDHVENSDAFEASAKEFVKKAWADRPADRAPDSFIPEALAVLSPRFKLALDAFREERYGEAVQRMHELSDAADPYLAWHATTFELKALVYLDRLEEAQLLAEALHEHVEKLASLTYLAGEVTYLLGYCQLQNLHYAEARETLAGFGERFPDAPERLRVMAAQMVRELTARREGGLGDVGDLMRYAGRELGHGRSGERVTEKQDRAVALLDNLIKEAEQAEQNASSSRQSSANQRPAGRQRQMQTPASPAEQSQVAPGPGHIGELRPAPVARPGEVWGRMPPADREAVLQPIRESFPGRYVELIEQYYRELAK